MRRSLKKSAFESHESDSQAAIVGGVFSEGQLAIELHALSRFKPGVFIRDALRSPLIFFAVVGGPPVMEVTVAVELPALIVEPMGQLVPNNRPDGSEICCIIRLPVKQRWLQDGRRKGNRIELWIVVCVGH